MIRPPVQATVTVLGAKSLFLSEKTVKNVILRVQLGHDGERVSSGLLNVKGKDWNWVVELDSLVSALDTCTILKVMIFEVSSSEKANNSCIGFVKFDLTRHRQNTPLTFPLYERVTSKMLAEETSSVQDRDAILKEKLSEKGSITLCIDRLVSGDKIPTAPSSPQNKVIGTPNAPPFRSDTAWHKSTAPFSRGDTTYISINKEPTGSPLLRDQARPFDPTYSSLPDSPVKDIRIPGFSTACRTQSPTHSFLLSVAIFTRAAQLFIDVALFSDVLTSTVLAISVWLMIISESVAMYGSLGIALFYLMRMNKYLKVTSSDRAELTEISSSENPFAWCYPDGMCFLSKISRFNCVVHDPMHLSESTMLFEHLVQRLRSLDWSLTPLVGFLFSIAANLLPATCLMKAIHLGYFVGIPGLYYFRAVPARWQANKDRSASIQAQIAAIVSTLAQAIRVKRPHKVVSNATKASPRSMRRPSQLRGMANSAVLHSTRHPTTLSSGSVLNGHGVSSFRFNGREPKANLVQLENADNVSSGESSPLAPSVGNGSMIFKGLASPTFSAGVISSPFAAQTTSSFPLSSEQAQMIIIFEFDDMNKKQKLLNRFVEVCGKIQRGWKKDPSVSLAHKSEQKAASDPDLINAILSLGLDLVAVRRSLRGYLMPSYISVEGDANTTPQHTAPILTTPHPSPSSTLSANASFDARSLDARAGMHTCDYITMESFHNTAHFSPMEISVLQDKISKCEWILPTKVIHHPPAVETSLCVAAVLLQLAAHRTIPVFSRCSNPYFTVLVPVVAQRDSDRDVTHWPPAPSERNTCPPKLLASLFSQWELSKERRMQVENLIPLLQQNISKPGEVNHPGGKAAHQEEVAEFPLLIEANELHAKRIKKSKSRESTGNVSKS